MGQLRISFPLQFNPSNYRTRRDVLLVNKKKIVLKIETCIPAYIWYKDLHIDAIIVSYISKSNKFRDLRLFLQINAGNVLRITVLHLKIK